jgi:hypothetical protein
MAFLTILIENNKIEINENIEKFISFVNLNTYIFAEQNFQKKEVEKNTRANISTH